MQVITRITGNLAVLTMILAGLAGMPLRLQGAEPETEGPGATRGRVSGVVLNSATGKPVAGAYVAVDRSGDAGGTNLGRFREQGIYVTTETDEKGRFVLEGVAFLDDHPFMVTHPGFVRHQETIALRRDEPDIDIQVRLRPAATLVAKVVDAGGRLLQEDAILRLEAKDGRGFFPLRADWPGPPYRVQSTKTGTFSFGELDTGAFTIEALRLDASGVIYHGKASDISVEAGERREVLVKPAEHGTAVKIRVEKDPYAAVGQMKGAVPVMLTRRPGLLAWACRNFHHPEDERLGRVFDNGILGAALVSPDAPDTLRMVGAKGRRAWVGEGSSPSFILLSPDMTFILRNLPPGEYAVFTFGMAMYKDWKSPAIYLRGAKAVVSPREEQTVEIPWVEPIGPSSLNTRVFHRQVTLEARDYAAREICELLIEESGAKPGEIVADSSIESEKLAFSGGKLQIWDLLETIYLKKGWTLEADYKAKKLVLRPSASS